MAKAKGDAFAKGIENIRPDVEYVIVTDADFTYPAKHVPKMIEILEQKPPQSAWFLETGSLKT